MFDYSQLCCMRRIVPVYVCSMTNLHIAALGVITGQPQTLAHVLEQGGSPHTPCRTGQTPLHLAAQSRCAAAVAVLLTADLADSINAADVHGWTAVHHAAHHGSATVLQALLEASASVTARGTDDVTPLHLAAGSAPVVQLLLDAGADRVAPDDKGCVPAQYAAQLGNDDAFFKLWQADDTLSVDVHGAHRGIARL